MHVNQREKKVESLLRQFCQYYALWSLLATVVDMVLHLVVVIKATRGLACDPSKESIESVDWSWLKPLMVILNIGNHGFYSTPLRAIEERYKSDVYFSSEFIPKCYPGMIHVFVGDFLDVLINTILVRCITSYMFALLENDVTVQWCFFSLSAIKLIIYKVAYVFNLHWFSFFGYTEGHVIEIVDLGLTVSSLGIMMLYINMITKSKATKNSKGLPTYAETLVKDGHLGVDVINKDKTALNREEKTIANLRLTLTK